MKYSSKSNIKNTKCGESSEAQHQRVFGAKYVKVVISKLFHHRVGGL